ncbi:hypothetical protein [Thalassomonas actiniarum]|uniref:Uncharacterized protein n=1 Tax=Thalassomonas actiniarum TaxID=485447 RepID=A0AAF0C115_9GAMM|nr:hypothetical protein [Thalassomonas actiniarum]WDD97072.1 hypothetical protein SG35_017115 [Thalassomonas actiniarum]
MYKGRYEVRDNMEFKDDNLYMKVGDKFDLTDNLKDDRVEIIVDGKTYYVDQDVISTCSRALRY